MITYSDLGRQKQLILFDCISGSTAYNLNIAGSDVDKKGVFFMPQKQLYGFNRQDQVANDSQDDVYFEIGRFLDLLSKNNPSILELLSTPQQFVLYKHAVMNSIKVEDFLSKLCLDTFAGYAQSQIKKARGLNKKINKPFDDERKSLLDFCWAVYKNNTVPLNEWFTLMGYNQQDCGVTRLAHFRDAYLLYHQSQLSPELELRGIVSGIDANDVQLSLVPEDTEPLAVMNFNKDGYSVYCREYREYKQWEEKRNQHRYQNTLSHGKNYDAKNMMHTFRLLNMAEEIARHHEVIIYRHDRDFLLSIRNGALDFDRLMDMAEEKMELIRDLFAKSTLPDVPILSDPEGLLIEIRTQLYKKFSSSA